MALVASFAESFGFSASCSVSSSFGAAVEVRVTGSAVTAERTIGGKCSGFRVGGSDEEGAATLATMKGEGDIDLRALRRAALDVGKVEVDEAEDIIFGAADLSWQRDLNLQGVLDRRSLDGRSIEFL